VLDLKDLIRAPLNGVGDGLSMSGAQHKCLEDQHVQSTLNHLGLERGLASWHILLSMIDQCLQAYNTASLRKGYNFY
jgi:hypothetical protein